MNNAIYCSKTTEMNTQYLKLTTAENQEISYDDFLMVYAALVEVIDTYDTMNPYNTYRIMKINADLDSKKAETFEYKIHADITFKQPDIDTQYSFSVNTDGIADGFDLALETGVMTILGLDKNAEYPKILITDVNAVIEALEE